MDKVYEEAFWEVNEVLKLMPIDLISKIPTQFIQIISENKATNYKLEIKEPLNQQNLKPETIAILGVIYRDFLASPEEREKLQEEDEDELKRIEQEETELVLYKKESFFRKIIKFIKGIFQKDKF